MPELSPSQRRAWTLGGLAAIVALLVAVIAVVVSRDDEPWRRTGPTITVSGWIAYWQVDAGLATFRAHSPLFADVSLMAYEAKGPTTIEQFPGMASYAIGDLDTAAAAAGVPALVTIFDAMPAGGMAGVLADPVTRRQHVETILAIVDAGAWDGVDLDYEQFRFADDRSTWAATQPNWIAFVTDLAAELHARGKQLVVTIPPIYDDGGPSDTGAWVYDYEALGEIVDRIRVMAYDYSVGEPGPIAPIEWVRSLVDAITELVPPHKVDLGIPVYGRDWVVALEGTCPADQEPRSRAISTDAAATLVATRSLEPVWDEETAEVRVDYTDVLTGVDASGADTTCAVQRTVRYLDADAIQERARLAWRADLHGVALWALGNDDAATWSGIEDARLGLRPGETLPPTTGSTIPAPTP